ncbi:MAG: ATP-binding protein [Leptolyngbyaceae cyanobacterium bins.59]|nr:ATP-binding protein [Leptolyngbyaceae cyanobacterium bins.59]
MDNPGRPSFRRVLLSRILLLSIPVLLTGEVIVYRSAQSGLRETVNQTLIESADRKAHQLQEAIQAVQANLLITSQISALQSGSSQETQPLLKQVQQTLPTRFQCLQLTDLATGILQANTCLNQVPTNKPVQLLQQLQISIQSNSGSTNSSRSANPEQLTRTALNWPQQQSASILGRSLMYTAPLHQSSPLHQSLPAGQISLVMGIPIYDSAGQLRSALTALVVIESPNSMEYSPPSLSGATLILDQSGTILSHPQTQKIGQTIQQEPDGEELQKILRQLLNGETVSTFEMRGIGAGNVPWTVGSAIITIPSNQDLNHRWVILAANRSDRIFYGLQEIQRVLILLTLGLVAAIVLATLYMARELSRPLEELGSYALQIQKRHSANPETVDLNQEQGSGPLNPAPHLAADVGTIPQNFKVRELNHLANALNSMVNRLEERAEELEAAWQEAEAANRLKSEFLANTSHELRTPLNAIIGCIRLIRDGCCDNQEEEAEFLQRADEAAIHLLNIINDLLDLAKIEAGTLSVFLEPTDLQQAITEVVNLQLMQLEQKGLQLTLPDLPEPVVVKADIAKLKQVLLNVICNAVKFTEQGGIDITTQFEALPVAGEDAASNVPTQVVITVKDTGIGIDPAEQPKLFQPFVMADGTTTRQHEGTGLGLAISRKLMNLMGGNITLFSAGKGHGTSVEITLQLVNSAEVNAKLVTNRAAIVQGSYAEITS